MKTCKLISAIRAGVSQFQLHASHSNIQNSTFHMLQRRHILCIWCFGQQHACGNQHPSNPLLAQLGHTILGKTISFLAATNPNFRPWLASYPGHPSPHKRVLFCGLGTRPRCDCESSVDDILMHALHLSVCYINI